jgi:exonuclease III
MQESEIHMHSRGEEGDMGEEEEEPNTTTMRTMTEREKGGAILEMEENIQNAIPEKEPLDRKYICWNIEGLRGFIKNNPNNNEFAEFQVILLVKTFMTNRCTIAEFFPNHVTYCQDAIQTKGRPKGICIAVKTEIPSKFISRGDNALCIKIDDTIVIASYFKPKTEITKIGEQLSEIWQTLPETQKIIIYGDFNCRVDRGNRGSRLREIIEGQGLYLQNNNQRHTYISHNGSSLIDLVFATGDTQVADFTVVRNPERKHQPITFTTSETPQKCRIDQNRAIRKINEEELMKRIEEKAQNINKELYGEPRTKRTLRGIS